MSIRDIYSFEIHKLENCIRDLGNGRVYELTQAKMDGSYTKISSNIQEALDDLINKIDRDSPGTKGQIRDALQNKKDK